jgi:hypothetical protein
LPRLACNEGGESVVDGSDPSEIRRRQIAIRRQLSELTENQGWVHHVADLDTGELITTPLDRPLAPLSRAERLARLGHHIDLPGPWGPIYRLTPRSPYRTAPLNWLTVYDSNYYMPDGEDLVLWILPQDLAPSPFPPGLRFHFDDPPQGYCVVTVVLNANAWSGATGHILVEAFFAPGTAATTRIPIVSIGSAEHTVDLSFQSVPGNPVEVFVSLEPGLHWVLFRSITLQAELVLDPTRI